MFEEFNDKVNENIAEQDKNNTWQAVCLVLDYIKLNRSLIMKERDLFEGFENILFEDFDESLEEFLRDKDNNKKE